MVGAFLFLLETNVEDVSSKVVELFAVLMPFDDLLLDDLVTVDVGV